MESLARLQTIADADGVTLLPEIHASYGEKVYEKLAAKGYAVYDFFLPGLMIDALERGSADTLAAWAQEILDKHILTVNMLGCHDGIPMLDLKGLLPEERIQNLIDLIVTRGGMVKNLHGQKNVYYQVNATYYSALGEAMQSCCWHGQFNCLCPENRRCGTLIYSRAKMTVRQWLAQARAATRKSTAQI